MGGSSQMEECPSSWDVERRIPSNVDKASAFLKEVIQQLKRLDWTEKDRFAIMIALEEALMNAVKHGNEHDESKFVDIRVTLDRDDCFVHVADEGPGFDPGKVPDPCEDCNLEKTSGRGVALIKNFVDEVNYKEPGNVLEFRKFRSSVDSSD